MVDGPTLSLRTEEGANAIDVTQLVRMLAGRGVVSGGEVHDGSAPFTVQVMATNGWFADSEAAVSESEIDGDTTIGTSAQRESAIVDLREYVDEIYPRKVLVCLPREPTGNAAGGDYHVVAGEPAQATPADFDEPYKTSEPSLPDLDGRPDLIPLAAGWIGANADEITEGDLWQRQQRPDAALRKALVGELHAATLVDGAGDRHDAGLADAADVTDAAINEAVNNNTGHAQDAPHDYLTPEEARNAVRNVVDVVELSGAAGTDGQLPFSTGESVNWATPPDEWGSLQAAIDDAEARGVTPAFDAATITDAAVGNSIEWPDGTVTTSSPSAAAGNVALLGDLGDVQRGAYADRHPPDGSGDVYFADQSGAGEQRGIYHDDPANDPAAWTALAIHPSDIDPGDLGFDPATQAELDGHAGRTDNPHDVGYGQTGALGATETATAADSAATAAKASALIDGGGTTPASGFVHSGDGDLTYEDGILTHWDGHESINGERSAFEVERWVGDTSDALVDWPINGYYHRCYNAYYDAATGDWRYLVSNEPAVRHSIRTVGGSGDVQASTAPEGLSGEAIDWQSATIKGGSIDEADHAAQADSATRADTADALDGRGAAGYATQLPRSRIIYQDVNGDGTDHLIRVNNATEFLAGGGVDSGQATFEIMASHIRNYSGGAGTLSKIRADMLVQRAGSDWYERTDYLYQTGCSRTYENVNAGDIRFGYSTPTYRSEPRITIRQIG